MLHTANMFYFYFVLVWIILIVSCQLPPADRRRCENSHRSSCSVSHTRQHMNTFSAMVFTTALHYGIHLRNSTASTLSHIQIHTKQKQKLCRRRARSGSQHRRATRASGRLLMLAARHADFDPAVAHAHRTPSTMRGGRRVDKLDVRTCMDVLAPAAHILKLERYRED